MRQTANDRALRVAQTMFNKHGIFHDAYAEEIALAIREAERDALERAAVAIAQEISVARHIWTKRTDADEAFLEGKEVAIGIVRKLKDEL